MPKRFLPIGMSTPQAIYMIHIVGNSRILSYTGPLGANNQCQFAAVGGALYAANGNSVLRWTPSDNGWEVIGYVNGGSTGYGCVNAIYVRGNYLYIGGDFTSVIGPATTANAARGQDGITIQCGDVAKLNLTNGLWSPGG